MVDDPIREPGIREAETLLADEIVAEFSDRPLLDYNDVIAGVAARAYTLGVITAREFTRVLDRNGAEVDPGQPRSVGAAMMREVWWWEDAAASAPQPLKVGYDVEELRARGDRLIPPNSVDGPLALALAQELHG